VAGFGVRVTIVEPGGYATDWAGSSAVRSAPLPDYDEVRERANEARAKRVSSPGDPVASASALLRVVDAEEPPLRVFFGSRPLAIAQADYASRIETWEK
jgi:NAD(P)-dependent dehydrogenase (short-subunit alcohol dehydrogenase family)